MGPKIHDEATKDYRSLCRRGEGGAGGGRGSLAYEILRSWEDLDVKLCSNHWMRGNMWVDLSYTIHELFLASE